MIIAIEASNIRSGGGKTHLVELLKHANLDIPETSIYIFADKNILNSLPDHPNLIKKNEWQFEKKGFFRFLWRIVLLDRRLKEINCDILFAPGSLYNGSFKPFVTLSQNILPFNSKETRKFFPNFDYFRLKLLKILQTKTFQKANGIIFLTNYARVHIDKFLNKEYLQSVRIPHGISERFFMKPKEQKPISAYSEENACKLIYVSTVAVSTYQWHIVEAISLSKKEGYPVELELVGNANRSAWKKLNTSINLHDPNIIFITYSDNISFYEIEKKYFTADAFVFASSCENLPNIMIEAMASGLPISSSFDGPMFEVLKDTGFYFDPESPISIYKSIKIMLESVDLRQSYSKKSYELAQKYTWEKCSIATFKFINEVYNNNI